MQKSKSAAFIALVAFVSFITPGCNGTSPNSNQSNTNSSIAQPKIGKWIPQFQSEYAKDVAGTNLALYAYTSLSVVSAETVCAAGDMPDPQDRNARVGVFLRTTDGGRTWKESLLRLPGLKDPALNSMHFATPDTGWIVGIDSKQNGIVLKTTDGGQSWIMSQAGFKQTPTSVFFVDENNGWMGGVTPMPASKAASRKGSKKTAEASASSDEDDEEEDLDGGPSDILSTSDGGKTWQSQRRISSSIADIFFLDANTGWAAGFNGVIYHTTNGGRIWTQQRSELEPLESFSAIQDDRLLRFALYGIHFFDQQNGMVAATTQGFDAGRVLSTSNSGDVWSRRWIVGDTGVRDVLLTSPTDAFAVVNNGTYVYRTVNGGSSWLAEPIDFAQNVAFFKLGAASPSKIWASGGGAIFFRVEE